MKKIITTIILLGIIILPVSLIAQNNTKYGDDPELCKKNLSEFRELVKQDKYTDALPKWRYAYTNCPKSTKRIYLDGVKIYKSIIKQETDKNKKDKYVDTLMQIYDNRIKYFGQEVKVSGRKGYDLYKYKYYPEAYVELNKSVELAINTNTKVEASILVSYVFASKRLYLNQNREQFVADYNKSIFLINILLEEYSDNESKKTRINKQKENLIKIANSCSISQEEITGQVSEEEITDTEKYSFPKEEPIISIKIPIDWDFSDDDGVLSFSPKGGTEIERLIVMIWASENPTADKAIDLITEEAFDIVESLLVDTEFSDETPEFDNNNIAFVSVDGTGYYVNEDGSKNHMSTSIILFMPDDTNIMTLVFFATDDAYEKYEEALLDIILSIAPY